MLKINILLKIVQKVPTNLQFFYFLDFRFLQSTQNPNQAMDNQKAEEMFNRIMQRFDQIDKSLARMNKLKECFAGDTLIDNQDLCQLLGVTKRTLARYRQKKLIRYYMIDGRTYYKASEIQEFLNIKGKQN